MPIRVFISHSSEDSEFVDLAHESLSRAGLEVTVDSAIPPGQFWEHALRSFANTADVLLVVVSKHSLASEWVKSECFTFLARKKENPNLVVIPLLLDDSQLPEFLSSYQISDFRVPERFADKLQLLAGQIRDRAPHGDYSGSFPMVGGEVKASPELKRLEQMILNAVNKGVRELDIHLKGMFEIFQKQQYMLTPDTISEKEKTAVSEIWVITSHLYNDTMDSDIRKSVHANLERGIDYKYFVDVSNPLIKRRIPEYEKLYSNFTGRYQFITLTAGLIMPFDEVVLYDPLEVNRIWGYAQMIYSVRGKGEDNLFLRLSGPHSISIASSLRHLAYPVGVSAPKL